jgi:polysaccharide transporter, PST family
MAQGLNYLIPLITLPFLVSHVGAQVFGVVAFGQAVAVYAQLVADYGFNISATRNVTIKRTGPHRELSVYVSTIMGAKIALLIPVFLVAIPLCWWHASSNSEMLAYVLLLASAVGNVLTPIWFYQGMNQMGPVAIASTVTKLLSAVGVLLWVRQPEDLVLTALVLSVPPILVGAVCVSMLLRSSVLDPTSVRIAGIITELKHGAPYFFSSAGGGILSSSGVFVLGIFHDSAVVGVYAAAEKIIKAAIGCLAPISQSLYPVNAQAFGKSVEAGFQSVRRTSIFLLVPAVLGTVTLYVIAPYGLAALKWVDPRYLDVIRWLCPWIFLGVLNNVLGVQVLGAMGRGKPYATIFAVAACFTIVNFVVLVPRMAEKGVILGMVGGELMLTCLAVVVIYRTMHAHSIR